jgi:hypothetical protein
MLTLLGLSDFLSPHIGDHRRDLMASKSARAQRNASGRVATWDDARDGLWEKLGLQLVMR